MTLVLLIVAILIIITLIVVLHELGHYLAARYYSVVAKSFSVGFGPEIIGRTDKRGTRWKLSAIPLGGYVKLQDDDDASMGMIELVPWHGFALIIVAGCLVNFVTGWLYIWLFTGHPGLAFELVGESVTGLPSGVLNTINHPGTNDNSVSGPIGIVDLLTDNPQLILVAFPVISLSLAVINMIPIPMLDGGHLVFGSIEHIRHKKFGEKAQMAMTFVSLFVVLSLFAFTTLSDIMRIITG